MLLKDPEKTFAHYLKVDVVEIAYAEFQCFSLQASLSIVG